jgi:lantibiotic modifying enzyme
MSSRSAKRTGASPREVFPDPAWWVPGLAPHERGRPGSDVRPEWAGLIEQALPAAGPSPVAADRRTAFGVSLRWLVAWACHQLVARAGGGVEPNAVAVRFAEQLTERLVDVATRTFERELGGPFAEEVRLLAEPGRLARLFTTYPVLARLLGDTARFAVDANVELLRRFAADRVAVVEALFEGVDPGPVVAVEAGKGDLHQCGRSVSVVVFADGSRVVYRPRDVAPHVRFTELVGWVNRVVPGIGLRTAAAVAGDGYGWLEFVAGAPTGGGAWYYRRQGVLLALLHAVRATDVHYQNMIGDGDQPVLVDVETLFHPRLPDPRAAADPAASALAASVYRTGLLPQFVVGATDAKDICGLGIDAADHEDALLAGFRCGYDAILCHRSEFAAFVERCAELPVRIVVRPTRLYTTLLDETTCPDLLRDARARDRVFAAALTGDAGLVRHELADLWAGDVPLFLGRADSHDIELSDGQRLSGVFDRTGTRDALDTVAALCEGDRRDQEWIISAAVAIRRPPDGHGDVTPLPGRVTGTVADPERLLAAACAIGDQIVARSMADRERVNWLGLELVDERQWLVLPMGAGLANGYLGVALFLAQLGVLSGIGRYGQVARHAVSAVPPLFETMAAHPAMVAAVGRGGLHGLGGIAFGLARIAVLLADGELRDLTRTAVELAASVDPESPGWATGTAGCLAAMTAVHAELGLPAAATLAEDCADHLMSEVDSMMPTAGFADGAAGIASALRRCAARHTRADRAAASAATALVETERAGRFGWCSGLAGLVLACSAADAAPWVRSLTERPLLRDLSLCHGELGIADVLTAIPGTEPARRRYAGLVLAAINRYGPRCGTPDGVPTPGLLTGLAGIGYGLLRLGFANQVPSVLLLETITGVRT